ncbi:MAG: hypothetical protein ACXVC6_02690 [Bacteroidia bacterium]
MKKILSPLFLLCLFNLTAQEQPAKIKEYGVGFSSLNSFSLQYRWGNEKMIYRVQGNLGANTAFGKSSISNSDIIDTNSNYTSTRDVKTTTPVNLNTGLNFSALALKPIFEKFGLMCGPTLGVQFSYRTALMSGTGTLSGTNTYPNGTYPNNISSKITNENIRPFIGITWGVFYKVHPSLFLYVEITPNIYYNYSKTTQHSTYTNTRAVTGDYSSSNNTFGISNLANSGAMITVAYRITK